MIFIGGAQPITGADPEMIEGCMAERFSFQAGSDQQHYKIMEFKVGGMLTYSLHSVQSMLLL